MKLCNFRECKNPVFSKGRCRIHPLREVINHPFNPRERVGNASSMQTRLKNFRKKKKYHNDSREYNGRFYDSKLEARVAEDIDWRIKSGEIKEVIPQFKISLNVNGKHITNYYCDFKVIMKDDSIQFWEAKGMATDTFKLKWKLLEALIDQIEPGATLIIIK